MLKEPQPDYLADLECGGIGAHLALPRSKEEYDLVRMAVTQLQTGPPTKIWVGMQYHSGEFHTGDNCGPVTQPFWAPGQPDYSGHHVVYSPPGVANSSEGWYSVVGYSNPFKTLCELLYCYRPDCVV